MRYCDAPALWDLVLDYTKDDRPVPDYLKPIFKDFIKLSPRDRSGGSTKPRDYRQTPYFKVDRKELQEAASALGYSIQELSIYLGENETYISGRLAAGQMPQDHQDALNALLGKEIFHPSDTKVISTPVNRARIEKIHVHASREEINEKLKDLGWSVPEFCEKLGVTKPYYHGSMTAQRFHPEVVDRINQLLGPDTITRKEKTHGPSTH